MEMFLLCQKHSILHLTYPSYLYDPCLDGPCTNCTSVLGTGNYTCHCPAGYTGQNCTEDIDECLENPCVGHKSFCVNTVNGYTCHCPIGLGGTDCQDNVTTCLDRECQNEGMCVDVPDIGRRCHCPPGFEGENCEEDINDCALEPCKNGAICKDLVNGYKCFCVPGFQGYHCDLDINECTAPCQNGATCLDLVAMYLCQCVPGFQGTDCEVNIDECNSAPCLNHGSCIDGGVNQYRCQCWTGTMNILFRLLNVMMSYWHIGVKGHFSLLITFFFTAGYEGDNCEVDIDECQLAPCVNGGQCFQRSDVLQYGQLPELSTAPFSYDQAAGYICHCQPGFTGKSQQRRYCNVLWIYSAYVSEWWKKNRKIEIKYNF
uniref:EGF-like domain-containing protein n=1 Tax=Periophthalmus magnuspinnatus TaxID=409849 RepID=A0A3B3Z6Z6_9GOBI